MRSAVLELEVEDEGFEEKFDEDWNEGVFDEDPLRASLARAYGSALRTLKGGLDVLHSIFLSVSPDNDHIFFFREAYRRFKQLAEESSEAGVHVDSYRKEAERLSVESERIFSGEAKIDQEIMLRHRYRGVVNNQGREGLRRRELSELPADNLRRPDSRYIDRIKQRFQNGSLLNRQTEKLTRDLSHYNIDPRHFLDRGLQELLDLVHEADSTKDAGERDYLRQLFCGKDFRFSDVFDFILSAGLLDPHEKPDSEDYQKKYNSLIELAREKGLVPGPTLSRGVYDD